MAQIWPISAGVAGRSRGGWLVSWRSRDRSDDSDARPVEMQLSVTSAGIRDAPTEFRIAQQLSAHLGRRRRRRQRPRPSRHAAAPGRRNRRKSRVRRGPWPGLPAPSRLVPAETSVGTRTRFGFDVERAHVGDEAENLDAIILRDFQKTGVFTPVQRRIGSGHDRQGDFGRFLAQPGPDLIEEKAEGNDVGEVAEGSDEEQALAGTLVLRPETGQIYTVGDTATLGRLRTRRSSSDITSTRR